MKCEGHADTCETGEECQEGESKCNDFDQTERSYKLKPVKQMSLKITHSMSVADLLRGFVKGA